MRSVTIPLPEQVAAQLVELATKEQRAPRAQASVLLIDAIQRAGRRLDSRPAVSSR